MKTRLTTLLLLILACTLLFSSAEAASKKKATPTPEPMEIEREVVDPPEAIQKVLDIAWQEWDTVHGKALPKSNKYTKWWNNYEWEWCAGFVTWCMLEAEIPQESQKTILSWEEGPVTGLMHCKASAPARLLEAYSHMHRTTKIPQKGFIVLYGEETNKTVHVGIVYDVEKLPSGKYRLTTIEGNMSKTVKMYIFDYDADSEFSIKNKYPDNSNITAVPEEEQTGEITKFRTYDIRVKNKNKKKPWYVTCFLMPWIPGESESTIAE